MDWDGLTPVRGQGLVLRDWTDADIPTMVTLFNTDEMDRWTPLPQPFDTDVATDYVRQAREAREGGTLALAITHDGGAPMGEVLLFPTETATGCEFAFAVGQEHRGQGLAARAVLALFPVAVSAGYQMSRLVIATGNTASQRSAVAAGFSLAPSPLQRRERKGYVLQMATWTRTLER
ncbi:GNAT family N-acetyltransferase [Ornithinimicrobium murale]|uniref:GNAT family N-acetyltransferase n=1 Tax=Ornithinimicrobium murale TaxID=1050153 RepID=UPI000E0D7752|nr:GNAT family N-acetyltransferase [Ornithinimicrobium murale]